MKDRMGREIDYMRFSITDRCNLRCKYCMPDGIDCMPRWDVLSLEEFEAIAIAAASLGIKKIKVTGGEPLARKSCPQLVKMLKNIPGIEKVTLTTNGVQLDRYLDQLLDAGLDAINVSLDTVDPVLYEKITGRDKLSEVMKVIEKAEDLPIPVKINAVSIDFRQLQTGGKATELSPQENWQSWEGSPRRILPPWRNLFPRRIPREKNPSTNWPPLPSLFFPARTLLRKRRRPKTLKNTKTVP